ncbi:MAG: hypothetical protein SNJ75_16755 [Gemmataceae bacterium]
MTRRRWLVLDLRSWLGGVTLLTYLLTTFGYPVLACRYSKPTGPAFPCQFRPCGCLTAEECWAGDCCCFTLQEKIAWADARGVAVPAAARAKAQQAHASEQKAQPARGCEHKAQPAPCCKQAEACPCCQPARETCCSEPESNSMPVAFAWVSGVSARKCRGEGSHSLSPLPWQNLIERSSWGLLALPGEYLPQQLMHRPSRSDSPPVPPPR